MSRLRQFIERNFYRFLLPCAKVYWFVFRPKTRGAKCLILAEGKVLLIQNSYNHYGKWNLPGGRVEKGEAPEIAAVREVKEELGIELQEVSKLGEYFTTKEYKRDTVYFYLAQLDKQPMFRYDPVEISRADWFPIEQLPEKVYLSVTKALEMYRDERTKDNR